MNVQAHTERSQECPPRSKFWEAAIDYETREEVGL
jgi:hypothetical protein